MRDGAVGEFNRKKLASVFADQGVCVGQATALDERRTDRPVESRAVFGKEDDVRYAVKEPRHAKQNLSAVYVRLRDGTELRGFASFHGGNFRRYHWTWNVTLLGSFRLFSIVLGQDGKLGVQ